MNYFGTQMHRLRYELRNVIADYPPIYLPLARWKSGTPATQVVDDKTQMLIEAWPRSGNTFAEQAFRLSQPRRVELAHHFHAPAQVIEAVKRGLPTLVIVRDAIDAVSSFLIKDSAISPEQALRSWIRFYEKVMPYRQGYVIATYDQVTRNFGDVVRRVNRRFDKDFAIFEHSPDNVALCFDMIESSNRKRFGPGSVEAGAPPASAERHEHQRAIRQALQAVELSPLVLRAKEINANYTTWSRDE